MKRLILILALTAKAFAGAQVCSTTSGHCGMGPDANTMINSLTITPSSTDSDKATIRWNTTASSDSLVTLLDGFAQETAFAYDPTMTTTHVINLVGLNASRSASFNPLISVSGVTSVAGVSATYTINNTGSLLKSGVNVQIVGSTPEYNVYGVATSVTTTQFTILQSSCTLIFPCTFDGVPAGGGGTIKALTITKNPFHAASNSHIVANGCAASFSNPLPVSALSDPCWSSTGPSDRGGAAPYVLTIPTIAGPLTSWTVAHTAPTRVFVGAAFTIDTQTMIANGSGATYPNVLMTNVTVDGTHCGTNSPTLGYFYFGNNTGTATCTGGLPTSDWVIALQSGYGAWNQNSPSTNGIQVAFKNPISVSPGNIGYAYSNWNGAGNLHTFVMVPSGATLGTHTITFDLNPTDTSGVFVAGQSKTITSTFTVEAVTPIPVSAPSSFPPWPFLGQFLSQSSYWGTWNCSNTTDARTGTGPWAYYNAAGVYENIPFSVNNWGSWAWNYDGGRYFIAMADRLFSTAHADWTASTSYAIGTIITNPSGDSFILSQVNGAASAGLTGTSGTSRPTFSGITPGGLVTDGPLTWLDIKSKIYWLGCSIQANDGYKNELLMTQGKANSGQEWAYFYTGILQTMYRTGDAWPGDYTGFTYQEQNLGYHGAAHYTTNINAQANACANVGGTGVGLQETGTSTYLQGSGALTMCYTGSYLNFLTTYPNANIPQNGRQRGQGLKSLVASWMAKNDATWINSDIGALMLRNVDINIAMLDVIETNNPSQVISIVGATGGGVSVHVIPPPYQYGQLAESLRDFYLAQIYYGLTPDARIPIVLKRIMDWIWINEFDRLYDLNVQAADGCFPTYPQCQGMRRLHSYNMSYKPVALSNPNAQSEFQVESSSASENGWIAAWLWVYNSTLVPPSNGRDSVSSYADIAKLMFQHAYDGRYCVANSSSDGGYCANWNIADYINGGRQTGAGMNQWINGSKTIQQDAVNILAEGIPYLTGAYPYTYSNFIPATNPCWTGGTGPCSGPTPFPDVQAPTPVNWTTNGGAAHLAEPAICPPGNYLSNGSVAYGKLSACAFATGKGLGTNNVLLNTNLISGTAATVTFLTYLNTSQCTLSWGTSSTTASSTANEFPAHTPGLAGGTPAPLYFHTITATGLSAGQKYHYGLTCTSTAGNIFTMPYFASTVPSFGGAEQNLFFVAGAPAPGTYFLPMYTPGP